MFRISVIILVIWISPTLVTACAPIEPAGAECRGLLYKRCTTNDGGYAGIETRMRYQEAHAIACANIASKNFLPNVSAYSHTGAPVIFDRPFCQQDINTLRSDYWTFTVDGAVRNVSLSIRFEHGEVTEISTGYSGLDP